MENTTHTHLYFDVIMSHINLSAYNFTENNQNASKPILNRWKIKTLEIYQNSCFLFIVVKDFIIMISGQ